MNSRTEDSSKHNVARQLRDELEKALLALSNISSYAGSEAKDQVHSTPEEDGRSGGEVEHECLGHALEDIPNLNVSSESESPELRKDEEQSDELLSAALRQKVLELETENMRLMEEAEKNDAATKDLQQISGRLQVDVLEMDKVRLNELLASAKEESEVLGRLVEKLSCDYDELKKLFDSGGAGSCKQSCCTLKDDKIKALRNTARALESENALLTKERENLEQELELQRRKSAATEKILAQSESAREDLRNELNAKDEERAQFLERFERLEDEKMNVLGQVNALHSELEICREDLIILEEEKRAWCHERSNSNDLLVALREGKKAVESKLQDVLTDNAGLSEQVQVSELRALSMEDAVRFLEVETSIKESSVNEMEQKFAEQTSLYESKITEMQRELSMRLEEIDENRDSEMRAVKERYIQLFNEKAEELHASKDELKKCAEELVAARRTISDLEYREEELQSLLNRTQASMEDKFKECAQEVKQEMEKLASHTENLERELDSLRRQYECLQVSYRNSVDALGRRLCDISSLLKDYQDMEERVKAKAAIVSRITTKNNKLKESSQAEEAKGEGKETPLLKEKSNSKKRKTKNKSKHKVAN